MAFWEFRSVGTMVRPKSCRAIRLGWYLFSAKTLQLSIQLIKTSLNGWIVSFVKQLEWQVPAICSEWFRFCVRILLSMLHGNVQIVKMSASTTIQVKLCDEISRILVTEMIWNKVAATELDGSCSRTAPSQICMSCAFAYCRLQIHKNTHYSASIRIDPTSGSNIWSLEDMKVFEYDFVEME